MRKRGAELDQLKRDIKDLRERGLSYPVIARLLGKSHTTIYYHANPNWAAEKRQKMSFRHYLNVILPKELDANPL
jgi:IS30 family transposase